MSLIKRERSGWPLDTTWSQDLVDRTFGDMLSTLFSGENLVDRFVDGSHVMRLEEYVDGDTCVIRAELPGIDPDSDVQIMVADGILRLQAERQQHEEETRPDGYRSEFRYGRLMRSVRLPEGTTDADVTATYRDGILEIRVPMPTAATPSEPKKIAITRS